VRTEASSWGYGRHYRRPIDGTALVAQLERDGWALVDTESGTGLAPHRGEDPCVLRVLARRIR
jgi:hypothetical protein